MVRLKHTGGFETYYLHLSAYRSGDPRRGARRAGTIDRPRRHDRDPRPARTSTIASSGTASSSIPCRCTPGKDPANRFLSSNSRNFESSRDTLLSPPVDDPPRRSPAPEARRRARHRRNRSAGRDVRCTESGRSRRATHTSLAARQTLRLYRRGWRSGVCFQREKQVLLTSYFSCSPSLPLYGPVSF